MKLKKTEHSNWYLDEDTNVLINKNSSELNDYRSRVQQAKEIDGLKDEVSELKTLLKQLMEK